MQTGQRRGRWTGVPLESRLALRRDNLINAGVQLLGSDAGLYGAARLPFLRAERAKNASHL